ncbi:MAG: NUDIX domain-containing protein [Succinivibrio sp.]
MAANELVDVVDEDDNVCGTVERHVMREQHLAHRASYIALMDPSGRFLVEIRTLTKDYAPGLFDAVVGGVMQHGEKPDESAARELMEEVGVDARDKEGSFEPLGKMRLPYRDGVHFLYAYLYLAKSPRVTIRQRDEVMGIMMLSKDELERLLGSCTWDSQIAFREIMRRARERGLLMQG